MDMRTRFVRYMLLALLLVLQAAPSGARELLVVGTHFGRVFERTESGVYVGLGVDVVRELARQAGHTVRFEMHPWARAQEIVALGLADILLGPYKTDERETRLAFAQQPFYQDQMVFFKRTASDVGWNGNFASLKGLRAYKILGWSYGAAFDHEFSQLPYFLTLEAGILRLSQGSIDLLATNRRNTETLMKEMKLVGAITPLEPVIDILNGYLAFPKQAKYEPLRAQFDQIFGTMVAQGRLAALGRKHKVQLP